MTVEQIEKEFEIEDGYKEIIFPKEYGMGRSFVGGEDDKNRLIVQYYIRKEDKRFFSKVYFGEKAQGPPFHAHGGSMAAVLDEAMGLGAWAASKSVVAANLNIEYIKMLKLLQVVIIETWVDSVDGRKVWMKSEIRDKNGILHTKGTGLYIIIPKEKVDQSGFHNQLKEQVEE